MDGQSAIDELEAQPSLKPGQEGWWRVWGATGQHIKPGDIVITKNGDEYEYLFIEDTYLAKAHPIRVGIVVEGRRNTIGVLTPILLMRRSTHHILAD